MQAAYRNCRLLSCLQSRHAHLQRRLSGKVTCYSYARKVTFRGSYLTLISVPVCAVGIMPVTAPRAGPGGRGTVFGFPLGPTDFPFLRSAQGGPGACPGTYSVGTRRRSHRRQSSRGVNITTHFGVMVKNWWSYAPILVIISSWCTQGQIHCVY